MSFGRLPFYRSPEQLGRMTERDWVILLDQLLALRNAEAFSTICDLFAFWLTGPERSRQLLRTLQTMESWDDEIRTVSSAYGPLYEGERLSDVARLARCIEIHRQEQRGGSALFAIATSEYVRGMVSLSIVASDLTSHAWTALVTSRHLGNLRRLVVHKTTLDEGDIRQLLQSRSLPELQTLRLTDLGMVARKMSLAQAEIPFPKLEHMDLSRNVLRTEGALLLAGAPWLAQLKWLAIRDNSISPAGIEALIDSPFVRTLTSIDARANNISTEHERILSALAERKHIELRL